MTTKPGLAVMLDWENFPSIRPNQKPIPLDEILTFLSAVYDVKVCTAYARSGTLSRVWRQRLEAAGFDVRLIDSFVESREKKNSLDLCLAMDAVRLGYTEDIDAFALLVAGDKDFAVVAAFIRRRLKRGAIAFGSAYCPNPSLAAEVDRYFLLEQREHWQRQLIEGSNLVGQVPVNEATKRAAEPYRDSVVHAIAVLGPDVPRRTGTLVPCLRERDERWAKPRRRRPRLARILEGLGVTLSHDRQHVVRWSRELLDAAGETGNTAVSPVVGHFKSRTQLEAIRVIVERAFGELESPCTCPLPLNSVGKIARHLDSSFTGHFNKRRRFWHALEDLGFALSDDHQLIVGAHTERARLLLYGKSQPSQLALFPGYQAEESSLADGTNPVEAAERELARKLAELSSVVPSKPAQRSLWE